MLLKEKILPYRKQVEILDRWLKKRLDTIIPMIMDRWDQDMWIVACEEYNEDPVLASMTPCAMMTARRITILVFCRGENGVERFSLARPHIGLDDYYESIWTKATGQNWNVQSDSKYQSPEDETQMECLERLIRIKQPKSIALNVSDSFAFGDGISHRFYSQISDIAEKLNIPVVHGDKLCVSWLETRLDEELAAYHGIVEIAHEIIDEAFSSQVILPGVTTNLDVKYWMMQKVIDLGLTPWFDFEVSIKREGKQEFENEEMTILPGDFLHCDIGLKYLGLCTDTQENAYILKAEETDVPAGLKEGMRIVNRLQDIVMENFKEGRSGNEILRLSREQAEAEGIRPCVYTHPIGYHGHAAGPTIGLWDMQQGVPGLQGTYPLFNHTMYSLELNATIDLPEWKDDAFVFPLETDIMFTNGKAVFAKERQTEFHVIR